MSDYNGYTPAEVRAWARGKNMYVEARGKIPSHVIHAFKKQHPTNKTVHSTGIAMPQPRKVVAAQTATRRTDKVKKPPCPVHRVAMVIQPELGYWKCPEEGCKLRAYPEEGATRSITGKGKITLVREQKKGAHDQFFLRSDNGVLMDISRIMGSGVEVEYSGGSPVATIELILNME